jgi:ankyrin repeat protein
MFIDAGANLEAKDNDGRTPLHVAAKWKHIEIARSLIEAKADLNTKDNHEHTPLYDAVSCGCIEIVEMLINKEANVDDSLIALAMNQKDFHIVQMLQKAVQQKAKDLANTVPNEQKSDLIKKRDKKTNDKNEELLKKAEKNITDSKIIKTSNTISASQVEKSESDAEHISVQEAYQENNSILCKTLSNNDDLEPSSNRQTTTLNNFELLPEKDTAYQDDNAINAMGLNKYESNSSETLN